MLYQLSYASMNLIVASWRPEKSAAEPRTIASITCYFQGCMQQQGRLIPEHFETRKPASPLYCHQDFLEKLQDNSTGKRAALLLQRLAVDPSRQHYKATLGANRGWRRSRPGGNHGSHFYAWWAPRGAVPVKNLAEFEDAPEGSVFVRDIRHHDDHSELAAQDLSDHYLPLGVEELRREEYGPSPWTPAQARFAKARSPVAILKGHPGSGKTTALWLAVDLAGAESVLYVTYSRDLAALAQDYFDRYCPSYKSFRVITLSALMRELAGSALETGLESERRSRFIGSAAAASAAEAVHWLTRNRPNFESALFPELHLAWSAAVKLRQSGESGGLLAEIGEHPAGDSLRWVRDMQKLAGQRPAEFGKVMTASEKKLLETILEQSLGVPRRKPAVRKATDAKRQPVKRKAPVK